MAIYNLEPIEESAVLPQEKGESVSIEQGEERVEQIGVSEGGLEQQPEVAKENSYEKVLEQAKSQTQSVSSTVTSSVKSDVLEISTVEEESRIQKLVSIAIEKSPEHAFRVAIELDDMYALDMLHDRLSHQLYEELVAKGLLKEE